MTAAQATGLTQRERVLQAMTALVGANGYSQTTVAQIARHARISRATFYEHFEDKQDCFIAAHRQLAEQLIEEVTGASRDSAPLDAWRATVAALVGFALREPATFKVLTHEAMTAGPGAQEERDRLMGVLGDTLEQAFAQTPESAPAPDISAALVVGGVVRLLSMHMRRGVQSTEPLVAELTQWIESYGTPEGRPRWRSLTPHGVPPIAAAEQPSASPAPLPLPKGRHRLPAETVTRVQRERIIHAAAQTIQGKGYANVTVADIVAAAGISREGFYTHFHDKQDAFMAVHEFILQQMVAVTAGAFFAGATWPERIWEGMSASLQFLERNPTIAHFSFVESYTIGPGAIKRVEDSHLGFTVFLQEGYELQARSNAPSRLALEAIAVTQFELGYLQARHSEAEISGFLPHLVHMALTPFLGPAETNRFIDGKMGVTY